ncbi:MAG: hypothetical protein V8R80_01895 [Eubacterium sp.]
MINTEERSTIQFAVVSKNETLVKIGKSFIMTPKPQCRENSIKWFDDRKLMHRGDAYK